MPHRAPGALGLVVEDEVVVAADVAVGAAEQRREVGVDAGRGRPGEGHDDGSAEAGLCEADVAARDEGGGHAPIGSRRGAGCASQPAGLLAADAVAVAVERVAPARVAAVDRRGARGADGGAAGVAHRARR